MCSRGEESWTAKPGVWRGDGSGAERHPWSLHRLLFSLGLSLLVLVLEFLVDDPQGGEEVPRKEDEEREPAHENLQDPRDESLMGDTRINQLGGV